MEKWILEKEKMPDFDGYYLCNISQVQPCGNVWNYYKIVNCKNNEWNIEIDEIVLSVLGACLIAISHLVNMRLCKRCKIN